MVRNYSDSFKPHQLYHYPLKLSKLILFGKASQGLKERRNILCRLETNNLRLSLAILHYTLMIALAEYHHQLIYYIIINLCVDVAHRCCPCQFLAIKWSQVQLMYKTDSVQVSLRLIKEDKRLIK